MLGDEEVDILPRSARDQTTRSSLWGAIALRDLSRTDFRRPSGSRLSKMGVEEGDTGGESDRTPGRKRRKVKKRKRRL